MIGTKSKVCTLVLWTHAIHYLNRNLKSVHLQDATLVKLDVTLVKHKLPLSHPLYMIHMTSTSAMNGTVPTATI